MLAGDQTRALTQMKEEGQLYGVRRAVTKLVRFSMTSPLHIWTSV